MGKSRLLNCYYHIYLQVKPLMAEGCAYEKFFVRIEKCLPLPGEDFMKFVNKYGLPEAFVRAVVNDPYSKGDSDFSATGLANPPRATALVEKHFHELEIDVTSRVAAIIGQGSHTIAERAARPGIDLCECRLFAKFMVDGKEYTVSAQVDLYAMDTGELTDWKTTKAYAFSKKAGGGQKPEWVAQLNVGAELLRRNGHKPKSLQIIAMLKDWNKREAGQPGMPESEVLSVDLPMWESSKVVAHIEERIRAHVAAKAKLPQCSTAETWGGNRCGQWCDASSVCSQFKNAQKTGLISPKAEPTEPPAPKEEKAPRAAPRLVQQTKPKSGWAQMLALKEERKKARA